jgi:FkbM family methyltransferase
MSKKTIKYQPGGALNWVYSLHKANAFTGQIALDIGANIGNHSAFFHAIGMTVISFEPGEDQADFLREVRDLNDPDGERWSVQQVAVGARKGTAKYHKSVEPPESGGFAMGQAIATKGGSIDMIRIDSLEFDRPVGLIKIDVEGYELQVIKGAKRIIEDHRPVMVVECNANTDNVQAVIDLLPNHSVVSDNFGKPIFFNHGTTLIFV